MIKTKSKTRVKSRKAIAKRKVKEKNKLKAYVYHRGLVKGKKKAKAKRKAITRVSLSGYEKTRTGIYVPANTAERKPIVPSKMAKGMEKALESVNEILEIMKNGSKDMGANLETVELEVSFTAEGKFMGFGVGGSSTMKLKFNTNEFEEKEEEEDEE